MKSIPRSESIGWLIEGVTTDVCMGVLDAFLSVSAELCLGAADDLAAVLVGLVEVREGLMAVCSASLSVSGSGRSS